MGPFWDPFWGLKLAYSWLFLGSFFGPVFEHFLDNFGGYAGGPFGDQIGPRGAKMGPREPFRASTYRKIAFAKTLENHLFFKVFGGPRPSRTASEDPRRLPRGYLGLLGAILSHLGAILGILNHLRAILAPSCARRVPEEAWVNVWRNF